MAFILHITHDYIIQFWEAHRNTIVHTVFWVLEQVSSPHASLPTQTQQGGRQALDYASALGKCLKELHGVHCNCLSKRQELKRSVKPQYCFDYLMYFNKTRKQVSDSQTFYIWENNQEISFHFHSQSCCQTVVILHTNHLQGTCISAALNSGRN